MTEDMGSKEESEGRPHPGDPESEKLPESTSMEETMDEDVTVENNKEEKVGIDEKVGREDQMEVDEGSNESNIEENEDEGEKKDDKEENGTEEAVDDKTGEEEVAGDKTGEEEVADDKTGEVEEVADDKTGEVEEVGGKTIEEAFAGPLKDVSNDDIIVNEVRKNSNTESHEKVHVTRSSKRVKDAAKPGPNTVKDSIQNDGDSQVDAPVTGPSLGNGVEVDESESVAVNAGVGFEVERSTGHHAVVPLDGQKSVDNGSVSCKIDQIVALPSGPFAPTLCKVKEEVQIVENIKEMSMSMYSTEPLQTSYFDFESSEGGESGTEDEQSAFLKELESVFKELYLEFKAPKFYGEPLNLLKLWRGVIKLGGYDKVTACKLWRQVGESFKPPKTCTTVSWTFRQFYEKALLDYERHKARGGTLNVPLPPAIPMSTEGQAVSNQTPGSGTGRMRRDAAARAMQGWHSQRLLNNGEVSDPIIKDKSAAPLKNREKHLKTIGLPKRKRPTAGETPPKSAPHPKVIKIQTENATIINIGPPADWVKVNVKTTKDCYEVYALVPGLLREEVRVQTDPAGRLVITGEPEQADNPWGVTPFKKVVTLPSRIDPHQTSAVVTLHGQLFVRVPFEQLD